MVRKGQTQVGRARHASAYAWVRQAHLKPRFSATLEFASKSSRPRFLNHLRHSMCAGLSQQRACACGHATRRRTQTMAVRDSASLPRAAPRLEVGQDEHEGAELRSCSPCGELSLWICRARRRACGIQTRTCQHTPLGQGTQAGGRWAVGARPRARMSVLVRPERSWRRQLEEPVLISICGQATGGPRQVGYHRSSQRRSGAGDARGSTGAGGMERVRGVVWRQKCGLGGLAVPDSVPASSSRHGVFEPAPLWRFGDDPKFSTFRFFSDGCST